MTGGETGTSMIVPHPDSAHVELLLGAYVLGALGPAEDTRVSGHLQVCDPCRIAYLDMADAPALLAMFSEDDLLDGPDGDQTP
ncbi:zf-HC2 domain-containing protein [Streptomyces sp. NPDC019443]|uniref:zf-HC2 domain-containing protein n=1 Tax=Streptomyces sp. NPDC019443 TaxID=3365061 RepID=UPI003789C47F